MVTPRFSNSPFGLVHAFFAPNLFFYVDSFQVWVALLFLVNRQQASSQYKRQFFAIKWKKLAA